MRPLRVLFLLMLIPLLPILGCYDEGWGEFEADPPDPAWIETLCVEKLPDGSQVGLHPALGPGQPAAAPPPAGRGVVAP